MFSGIANAMQKITRDIASGADSRAIGFRRLSTGNRITRAADDAAGLGIAEGLNASTRSMRQALRNANDGISVTQTADGALAETANMIKRLRELAAAAASESLATAERGYLNDEATALKAEITRIGNTTSFNGRSLLNASQDLNVWVSDGPSNASLAVPLSAARATDLVSTTAVTGNGTISNAVLSTTGNVPNNNIVAQTLTIAGPSGSGNVVIPGVGRSAKWIAAQVNSLTGTTGVSATATTEATFSWSGISSSTSLSFILYKAGVEETSTNAVIGATVASDTDLAGIITAINATTGTLGITASDRGDGTIKLVQSRVRISASGTSPRLR